MKIPSGITALLAAQKPLARYAIFSGAVILVALLAGTASAALGGPNVISLLSHGNNPANTEHTAVSGQQLTTSTPAPAPTSTPSPVKTAAPPSGVTVSGNTYGQHLANEPTATTWSSKPLVLSTHSVTVAAGTTSANVTATSPDGYTLCLIAGLTPDENIGVQNISASPNDSCGPVRTFNLRVASAETPGTYNLHLEVETASLGTGATRYVHYDGYITVNVTPYTPPYPTMTPVPTVTP